MMFMIWQHFTGALAWHRGKGDMTHRKMGRRIAMGGRIVAGIGWCIG